MTARPPHTWSVTISTRAGIPTVTCSSRHSFPAQSGIPLMDQVRRHLASHLAATALPFSVQAELRGELAITIRL